MAQVFEQVPNRKIPIPTLEKLPIPVARCNFIKYVDYPISSILFGNTCHYTSYNDPVVLSLGNEQYD